MGKQSITGNQASRIVWDNLEEWVRKKVQEFIQSLLEEEITELLGRQKSERQLYLHGLALGDFDLALRDLLGEEVPASTVARLEEGWQAEWEGGRSVRCMTRKCLYVGGWRVC